MKKDAVLPHSILVSYFYTETWDLNLWPHLRMVADSGAYSSRSLGKEISIDGLGLWAAKWRHRFFWTASLDVAGDQKTSRANWNYLNTHFGLQTIPSIHIGDDPKMLDYYAERGCDFVGLGGVAGGRIPPQAIMRWLIRTFIYARESWPGMRFHGWGMTGRMTQDLPFWSVDSSSWLTGVRYGAIPLTHPDTGKRVTMRLNGKDAYKPEISNLLVNHFGISPAEVAVSNNQTWRRVTQLQALNALEYERRARIKHEPISPPSWGIGSTLGHNMHGPMQVLANNDKKIFTFAADLNASGAANG